MMRGRSKRVDAVSYAVCKWTLVEQHRKKMSEEKDFEAWWEKVEGRKLTPEEKEFLEWLERSEGRKLTDQQRHLALEQARQIGDL
jgi:hypothetical protein